MRSWRSRIAVIAFVLTGCGASDIGDDGGDDPGPTPDQCEQSFLDYENFGAVFVSNWCRGCHSSVVPEAMRQGAPVEVNFDDYAKTMAWKDRILLRATGDAPTMPPVGGPSAEERELLEEWLACGGAE